MFLLIVIGIWVIALTACNALMIAAWLAMCALGVVVWIEVCA